MKHWEITYWLNGQSRLFSRPQRVVAKSSLERDAIIKKCEDCGYEIEQVSAFDPVPVEERFYA